MPNPTLRTLASLALLLAHAAVAQPAAISNPLVTEVGDIGITVGDLDKAVHFYTTVLTFRELGRTESHGDEAEALAGTFGVRAREARLALGDERVTLTEYLAPEGRPIPADSRSNDRWFQHIALVVTDMDRAYTHLRSHRVRHASAGPQTLPAWNKDAGGISAFYFKDPEGHVLEVIHFPPGKGDPRWQQPAPPTTATPTPDSARPLFLGIDHTAIVVADTDASLALYRDTLGLTVAGGAENYGPEQERLNNVFGVRLRITNLRAARGPGIELLEYLAPATGRPYPGDTQAPDHWNWTTGVVTPSADAAHTKLRSAPGSLVSPRPASVDGAPPAFTIRDPDGHALRVSQARDASSAPASH